MIKDYVPQSEDNLTPWLLGFTDNIEDQATTLGLDSAKVTAAVSLASAARSAIAVAGNAYTAYLSALDDRDAKVAAAVEAIRTLAGQGKKSAGYTEAIGTLLGWVGPGDSFDPATYKAEIRKAETTAPVEVTLAFRKASGNIEGVNVYSRRQGESAWRSLGFRSRSPYIDHSALAVAGTAETREYRVRGVIADAEIGQFSDNAQVTVSA